jgi:hypothetical protein
MTTVTTTPQRVEQMIEAQMEMTNGRGSNMFLFIDQASLEASNPLDAVWLTGKGERIRLTDWLRSGPVVLIHSKIELSLSPAEVHSSR